HPRLFVASPRESEGGGLRGGQPVERLRSLLEVVDVGVREAADRIALRERGQPDHSTGGGDRQRAQQEGVDQAEDRSGSAPAERRGQQDSQREALVAANEPKRVSNLMNGDGHLIDIRRSARRVPDRRL